MSVRNLWVISHNAWCCSAGVEMCLQWTGRVANLGNCHVWGKPAQASRAYPTGLQHLQPHIKLVQRTFLMHLQEVHCPCMLLVGLKSCLIYLHLTSVICMQLLNCAHVKHLLLILQFENCLKLRCKLPHLTL